MYLVYLDESGSEDSEHFVVGGLAVHEQDVLTLSAAIDSLVSEVFPLALNEELHTQHIRAGKGAWRRIPRADRERFLDRVVELLLTRSARGTAPALFAVVMHKPSFPNHDPNERVYEEFFARANSLAVRLVSAGSPHRLLAIADKSRLEHTLQELMAGWRKFGGSTGGPIRPMRGYAEVPLFVESKASRLTQLSDFIAHWVYRSYESGDGERLRRLLPAFDSDGQTLHGLVHLVHGYRTCPCPACISRR